MEILLWLYVIAGLLLVSLSLPLMLRKVPPNGLYGFRVKATLEDPELWYDVNAYAARGLLICGVVIVTSAILLAQLNLGVDAYALACLVAFVIPFAVTLYYSIRYLRARETESAGR